MYNNTNKPMGASHLWMEHCQLFADGMMYIHTSQWPFAYSAFSNLYQNSKSKSVALLYNMALCHYIAKEYTKAFTVLSEALTELSAPSITNYPIHPLPDTLLSYEFDNNHHHLALSEIAATLNTKLVKLRIRRLLVDVQLELQNWHEVIRLSTLSEMNKCKNV